MTPPTKRVAPDGSEIAFLGAKPGGKGQRGAPAIDALGRARCVECLTLLPEDRGRSPYCTDCRSKAVKAAWKRRNLARQSVTAKRDALRDEPRWESDGYTHGRSGLYIDRELLTEMQSTLNGLLSAHLTWTDLVGKPFDPAEGRRYHRALQDLLGAIEDANSTLRGPFWPRADGSATRLQPE